MKKELNTKLIELLHKLDFHLVEFNNKSCLKNKTVSAQGLNKRYLVLNYLVTIKSVKQVARVFQFFKSKETQLLPSLYANSRSLFEILCLFLKDSDSSFQRINFSKLNTKTHSGLALFLNKKVSHKDFLKNFQKQNYLFLELNGEMLSSNYGFYKILANFNDWKKILFLALLIKHFKV